MSATQPAIRVRDLSKTFRVGGHPSDVLRELLGGRPRHTDFHSLTGVSFDVMPGEVVGVVGRNGAGKSTLLKILTGTLEGSSGEVAINGKVSAILELGTGFNPELSGRENVYLGGFCLGMSRREIDGKFDEIVAFSELKAFIDQPFKTYSSGMKARLTFSLAVSVDPEVLIIDEALSVGDARFQRKCFARFGEFRARGKTILFVSHDQNAVTSFCTRAILLEQGRVLQDGPPAAIVKRYLELLFGTGEPEASPEAASAPECPPASNATEHPVSALPDAPPPPPPTGRLLPARPGEHRFGNGDAEIVEFGIRDRNGQRVDILQSGQSCVFHLRIYCHRAVEDLSCGILIRDTRGIDLFGMTNLTVGEAIGARPAGAWLEARIAVTMWLAAGDYFATFGVARLDGVQYDSRNDALHFTVVGTPDIFTTSIVNLDARLTVHDLAALPPDPVHTAQP